MILARSVSSFHSTARDGRGSDAGMNDLRRALLLQAAALNQTNPVRTTLHELRRRKIYNIYVLGNNL